MCPCMHPGYVLDVRQSAPKFTGMGLQGKA